MKTTGGVSNASAEINSWTAAVDPEPANITASFSEALE